MNESESVFAAAVEAAGAGRSTVLATIVRARGSTPRGLGSRMLVDPARGLVGTVGGGCGEAQVIEAAGEVLQTGRPTRIRVELTDDLAGWSPAVCGGVFDVLLEPIRPDVG